jgi:hypothetical protein
VYLKTQLDQNGTTVPADGEAVPQHTKDCFGCRGHGYIHAGIHLETGRDLLSPCDVHVFQPSRDTMDGEYDGVLVAWSEDADGEMQLLAVTADARLARTALTKYCNNRMYRRSLAGSEVTQWVVFSRPGKATAHLVESGWAFTPSSPDDPNAVHITRISAVRELV